MSYQLGIASVRRRSALLMIGFICGGGCASPPSPWQQFYTPHPLTKSVKLTPTDSVQVRSVEPERLNAWVSDAQARRLKSDVAVEDLTTQDRIDETNRLLTVLRIPERAPNAYVLGISQFTFESALPADDARLTAFAKQIGADYAVVSCQFGGSTNQIVMQPITTFSTAHATASATGGAGYSTGYASGYGTSTTLVPTQVQRNVFFHNAFFIRRLRPQDPPFH